MVALFTGIHVKRSYNCLSKLDTHFSQLWWISQFAMVTKSFKLQCCTKADMSPWDYVTSFLFVVNECSTLWCIPLKTVVESITNLCIMHSLYLLSTAISMTECNHSVKARRVFEAYWIQAYLYLYLTKSIWWPFAAVNMDPMYWLEK